MRRRVLTLILTALASPAAADDGLVAKGARIYDENCSTCHGDELVNNTGVAFDLRRLKAGEHERFVTSVLNGKKAMPSWRGALSAEQIEALWAYIRVNAYEP